MNKNMSNLISELAREQNAQHLLSGVRLFSLQDWNESMIMNEFHNVGMIPEHVLFLLQDRYSCTDLLELTRFCVQRGRWYYPANSLSSFSNQVARDLTYATVYAQAQS